MPLQWSKELAEENRVPYGNFAFHVAIDPVEGSSFAPWGNTNAGLVGSFSEVSGIEAVMEHKVIKVGGHNYGTTMRAGPVTFGTVVLKRGIIRTQLLWRWWSVFTGADAEAPGSGNGPVGGRPVQANRGHVLIGLARVGDETRQVMDAEKLPEPAIAFGWRLRNAMPVKFRVGDLNAKGTDVAVEELHLVHEGLEMAGVVG